MSSGWIKLHRKILDNPIVCKDSDTFAIWTYMLLMAAHDETDVLFRGDRITLHPGQFVSSVRTIAQQLGVEHTKVHRIIKTLKSETQVATQESNKNTLFTIKNWDKYQISATQNATRVQHECNTSATQNKNEKNDNNIYIVSDETISRTTDHEDVQRAVQAWNEMAKLTGLPIVTKLVSNTKREKMLRARIRDYGVDDVIKAFNRVKQSQFLQGKKTDFVATFEWVVKPNNFGKVLEGNYDDSRRSANTSSGTVEQYSVKGWAERSGMK